MLQKIVTNMFIKGIAPHPGFWSGYGPEYIGYIYIYQYHKCIDLICMKAYSNFISAISNNFPFWICNKYRERNKKCKKLKLNITIFLFAPSHTFFFKKIFLGEIFIFEWFLLVDKTSQAHRTNFSRRSDQPSSWTPWRHIYRNKREAGSW